jgi:hypothetical protein
MGWYIPPVRMRAKVRTGNNLELDVKESKRLLSFVYGFLWLVSARVNVYVERHNETAFFISATVKAKGRTYRIHRRVSSPENCFIIAQVKDGKASISIERAGRCFDEVSFNLGNSLGRQLMRLNFTNRPHIEWVEWVDAK